MSVELKPCPFCGEMLEKKHVRKTKSRKGYDYYQHPDNQCILADVDDGFPFTAYDDDADDWNRRAETCALPEGHGRLIDAEKLKAKKYHSDITHENAVSVAEIDWAETIVPADTAERSET